MAKCFNGNILPTTMKTENFREDKKQKDFCDSYIHNILGDQIKKLTDEWRRNSIVLSFNVTLRSMIWNPIRKIQILDVILNGSNK